MGPPVVSQRALIPLNRFVDDAALRAISFQHLDAVLRGQRPPTPSHNAIYNSATLVAVYEHLWR